MIVLDASVALGLANSTDVHHARAKTLLSELQSDGSRLLLTDYVFNEIIGVMLRKVGKKKAMAFGEYLLQSTFIAHTDGAMLKDAWSLFTKTTLGLSLVDCALVVTAKRAHAKGIATFDNEFKRAGIAVFA
ncbi:MAG TPA: PIN domain-containing protein [Candidatus Binatia bacterium]|nr:PIN domain-containing protein [Candidatus Binatia bacterium]